ncbi:SLC13 family permease [Azospirillum halopraeferens]|uniref:SLC13 family permease n=1 Tax=Azospirillum halopraeferens TaxID=34010 RepID=UPI0003F98D90|nr:SLC13 family permease [Azospirillum halopraeferens]
MGFDQAVLTAILAAMLAAFAAGRWRYDVVAVAGLMAAVLAGPVPAAVAFSGFANPAVITVAAVLVLSRAATRSGAFDRLAGGLLAGTRTVPVQLAILCGLGAVASAFMNNIGAISLFIPVALGLARRHGRSPGLYLMPLSYATLLGGMISLIGTPANLLVSQVRADATGAPFGLLSFAAVGVPLAALGVAYLALVGWRCLPAARDGGGEEAAAVIGPFDTELVVTPASRHAGRTVADLERDAGVEVHAIVRDGRRVFARLDREAVREGDVLAVRAAADALRRLARAPGLAIAAGPGSGGALTEVVVAPDSLMQGSCALTLDLEDRWGVTLVAAARRGRRNEGRLAEATLSTGDVLLLRGDPAAAGRAAADLGGLVLAERDLALPQPRSGVAAAIFGTAVLAAALGFGRPEIVFMAGVLALVLIGGERPSEVYRGVEWPVIVLLAAMIPLGEALQTTGTAGLAAGSVLAVAGGAGPAVLLVLVLAATMLLTPVLNNPATVAVMAPVALDLAGRLGVSADPFLVAVAIGASCDFLTPFGHHNNALVMGPGGYRFGDFARVGAGLEVLVLVAAPVLILLAWPW